MPLRPTFLIFLISLWLFGCTGQFQPLALNCQGTKCNSTGGGNREPNAEKPPSTETIPPVVVNEPAAPVGLVLSGPVDIAPNNCAGPYKISFVDANGTPAATPAARTVHLAFEASNGAPGRLYSDGQCTTLTSGYAFAANTAEKEFWFKNPAPTVAFLVATDTLQFFEATFKVNVRSATGALLSRANLTRDIFPVVRYNTTFEKTWAITNVGAAAATGLSLTFAAPFAFKGGAYPGTGGTCATTLAAGATCTVVAVITIADSTARGANTLTQLNSLSYNNGTTAVELDFDQNVMVLPKTLALRFDGGPQYNFAPRFTQSGAGVPKIITLTNVSNMNITNLLLSLGSALNDPSGYAYEGGSFPGTKGTCTTTLAAGASCKISMVSTSNASGLYSRGIRALNAQFLLGTATTATTEIAGFTAFGIP